MGERFSTFLAFFSFLIVAGNEIAFFFFFLMHPPKFFIWPHSQFLACIIIIVNAVS